jgi:leucyl aminopeptidase (aminopeptidase T)
MTLLPSTIHSTTANASTVPPVTAGLDRAAQTVVQRSLAVREGEDVLVVTDETLHDVGAALRAAAQRADADAVLMVMAPRAEHGTEPPRPVAEALAACDVFIAPTSRSLSHTRARVRASASGARGATMPTVTADMLARLMDVDFDALRARSKAVAELLDAADEAHVICPRGTDLRLDLGGRRGHVDDGDLSAPGAFGNLPCGEGFIAPAGGEGTVATRSLAGIGVVQGHPARLTVAGGELAEARGAEGERLWALLSAHGAAGRNLAELGVGTNDRARLTGNILEDEKILGTVHVAFGASAAMGGNVSVPIHLDVVVSDASLTIGTTAVLDAGRYVL